MRERVGRGMIALPYSDGTAAIARGSYEQRIGLVTVLRRSLISLCHLGFEGERADAAKV